MLNVLWITETSKRSNVKTEPGCNIECMDCAGSRRPV